MKFVFLCQVLIFAVAGVSYYFHGFDQEEVGYLILPLLMPLGTCLGLYLFFSELEIEKFSRYGVIINCIIVGIVISLKSVFNLLRFMDMFIIVMILEALYSLFLIYLLNKSYQWMLRELEYYKTGDGNPINRLL